MPPTNRRQLSTIATLILAIAGCSGIGSPSTRMSPIAVQPGSDSPGSAAPAASASPASAAAGDAWLIVGRTGEETVRVILDSTLEELVSLPLGVPDATWGRILTATPRDRTTVVEHLMVQPGLGGPRQEIDGQWRLPMVGLDPVPVGVSADRSTIVLVGEATPTTSRFAVLDINLATEPRIIELAGAFDYDALSPDGAILYVAEHVADPLAGRYQVRAVDTATGYLRDTIIVDKRNLDEVMAGTPIDQDRRADGLVLTLYRGAEYPFVHALDSVEAWAVCIDLPTRGFDDEGAGADWGIVSVGQGTSIVAVNATLGIAVEIDPTDLTIRRTIDFEASAGAGFALAKFGHGEIGPAGRRVVAAPDGSSVYAAGVGGVVRLGATDLDVQQRYMTGMSVDSVTVTPDGETLFVLARLGGIARLDAHTGELEGWVGDGGFDRLLGALPW